jgi:hypothetical protein
MVIHSNVGSSIFFLRGMQEPSKIYRIVFIADILKLIANLETAHFQSVCVYL